MPDDLAADVLAIAKAAGLDLALSQFPQDVAAAALSARTVAAALRLPENPRAEPWPPMQTGLPV